MKKKELANDLVHTNSEYEKLKGKSDDGTPRETPSAQGPGRSGYDKQDYDQWTQEELLQQAQRLEIPAASDMTRAELESALISRDTTQARRGK